MQAAHKRNLILIHPDRTIRFAAADRLPFTTSNLDDTATFFLNPGIDASYHHHWFPERSIIKTSYKELLKDVSTLPLNSRGIRPTATAKATPSAPTAQPTTSNNPTTGAGSTFRRTFGGTGSTFRSTFGGTGTGTNGGPSGSKPPPGSGSYGTSSFFARRRFDPSRRSISPPISSPSQKANARRKEKYRGREDHDRSAPYIPPTAPATTSGTGALFLQASGSLQANNTASNDNRIAVVGTINARGRLNLRISIYNIGQLYTQHVDGSGYLLLMPSNLRYYAGNITSIAFADVVTTPAFYGLTYVDFRAEVSRLSGIAADQRFRHYWLAIPPNWDNTTSSGPPPRAIRRGRGGGRGGSGQGSGSGAIGYRSTDDGNPWEFTPFRRDEV
ncbi:hypothetical protein SCUP234_08618 [Seiridium cupressi]